ncbi:MAG: hypothetical protein ACREX8_06230, partial [Gammaproteobacteria bacterium]
PTQPGRGRTLADEILFWKKIRNEERTKSAGVALPHPSGRSPVFLPVQAPLDSGQRPGVRGSARREPGMAGGRCGST